jgi:tRNA (guanine-N7-)-methyltransferase
MTKMTEQVTYKRPVRSFVRRLGRMTPSQKIGLERHLAKFGFTLEDDLASVLDGKQEVVLDIGFGMGEGLLAQALMHPQTLHIGIEVHEPGVGRLLNQVQEHQLQNIRVFVLDANDVLGKVIPHGTLDKVQIFFPDPWPKKKHHKRRIVNPAFVKLIAQKLKPEGILHIATDWDDYAQSIVEVMGSISEFNLASIQLQSQLGEMRPNSRFEQRGLRLGHAIHDLVYQSKL